MFKTQSVSSNISYKSTQAHETKYILLIGQKKESCKMPNNKYPEVAVFRQHVRVPISLLAGYETGTIQDIFC